MLFQKQISPKNLSINEMWNLYRILEPSLSSKSETFLIDELDRIMGQLTPIQFHQALDCMYDRIDHESIPVELLLRFADGIKINELFSFFDFIQELNGSSKR